MCEYRMKAKVGDTILINHDVAKLNNNISECEGRKFVVLEVSEDRVYIACPNVDDPAFFCHNEYDVVSEQRQVISDQKCPECKGAGKVLLLNFDSPCSLCG